jgi:hypothetical protein
MANETAKTSGGKTLAQKVYDFMDANMQAMKADSPNRDADANEKQGLIDVSNAIAFAVEEVMKGPFLPLAAPGDITLTTMCPTPGGPVPVPATGSIVQNIQNPKYPFK